LSTSPLDRLHRERGAYMTDFAGWRLPLRFGSELAEHTAVRTAAGMFDLSHMGQLRISGPGAGPGLDAALSASHADMRLGRAAYSLALTADGGILDDLIVYRLAEDDYLVVANAANRALIAGELTERLAGFDARLTDATADRTLIAVQGPRSAQVLAAAGLAGSARGLAYYTAARTDFAGTEVLIARTGYTGEDGFEVFGPAESAERLWLAIEAAGEPFELVPAGLAARDSLRLEAGMPLYGQELTRATSPWDAGLDRFVDLAKPEFVGRAALVDGDGARVERTRRLIGLVGQGRRAARAGYPILREAAAQAFGEITSGALSPTLGYPIAMAYVDSDAGLALGDQVAVGIRGTVQTFTVAARPFYRRSNI
jgi:aminomethyltransferase